ncbi:MAG: hypothetical protein CMP43_01340, partial [Rickettsiales bacterium]|nr:hypothetical protein [Rickettsiales bacterium]
IYVNLEGRPQISRQVKLPLPSVDDFSVVLKKISKSVNINLGYSNPQELRELMLKNFNHIAKVNNITESKLPKERKIKNAFLNSEIKSSVNNFYMTDSVSRNSPVMSECSMNFYKT